MSYEDISIEESELTATIGIDIPPANVLSLNTIQELQTAFEELDTVTRRVVILESKNDKLFSGGVEVEDHVGDKLPKMMNAFSDLFATMRSINTPILGKINGPALGGGCELAAGCDIALATESAKFGQPEVNLGTFPPIAAAAYPEMMGEKEAFEFIMAGEEISAEKASQLGLVNRVVSADSLDDEIANIVENLSRKSGFTLGKSKEAFYRACDAQSTEKALAIATNQGIEITDSKDGREGLNAFIEDREPEWTH